MWSKVLSTVFIRGYAALASLILVVVTAKILGAEARGEIALVILGVTIIGMFQALIGGPSLTYFASKRSLNSLLYNASIWSILSGITIGLFLSFTELSPWIYNWQLITIAVTQGIITAQHSYLVGREKILTYGVLDAVRTTVLWTYVVYRFYIAQSRSVDEVLLAYIFANVLTTILGFAFLIKDRTDAIKDKAQLKEMFRYGSQIQLNNLSQLFNYRFVYYLVEKVKGIEALGVFSVAIAVAESIWIICKSIATILLSRLVNTTEEQVQKSLTIKLSIVSVLATIFATFIILMVPHSVFISLFGRDFSAISEVILWFSPAVVLLAYFTMINHYFIARDKNWINIKASLVGNTVLLIGTFYFVSNYSLQGAALICGLAYLAMSIYLTIAFQRK